MRAFILGGKDYGPSTTMLIDAFERSTLAESSIGIAKWIAQSCQGDENRAKCEEDMRHVSEALCSIGDQQTDCARSQAFITEHMTN